MKTEPKREETKRDYEKPKMRVIKLSADEMLATGCKTGGGMGFGNTSPCAVGFCSSTFGS